MITLSLADEYVIINKVRHPIAKVLLLGFFSRLESILAFEELN